MMELWLVVSLIVALLALRRALGAERMLGRLRDDIAVLRQRLAALEPVEGSGVGRGPMPTPAPSAAAVDLAATSTAAPSSATSIPALSSLPAPPVIFPPARMPEPESPPVAPLPASGSEAAPGDHETLETEIGSRWLLYLGTATLVLGLSYFIKYAFENEWIPPALRVVLGAAAGLGLIVAGLRFASRGLPQFGQALVGGGLGTLYLSIYAAYHWYALIDRVPAFVTMIAVTVAGAILANRQRSQALALLSIAVGFLVPFLVGGETGSQVTLFTYDLILAGGTLYLARRREWPTLNLVSYLLTAFTLLAWAEKGFDPRQYWITELFLTAFLVLFLRVRHESRHATGPVASLAQVALGLAPVFYHVASLAVLRAQRGALFVYLIGFSVVGAIAGAHQRLPWVRLLVWFGAAVPCLDIASGRVSPGWLPGAWITLIAIFGVHLIAQIQALDDERPTLPAVEVVLLHGNALWMLACLWLLVSPRALVAMPRLIIMLAALYGALAFVGRRWHTEAALHATALAATLTTVAVALKFSGPWLIVALAAEAAGLAYLGLRTGRGWLRAAGLALGFVATLLAAERLAAPASVSAWPFFNPRTLTALFVVAMLLLTAALHRRAPSPSDAHGTTIATLVVVANLLVLAVLSSEIAAFYAARAWVLGEVGGSAGSTWLAHQLTLSLVWAAYAVALVAIGLRWRYRPIRYLAIAVFAVTMVKVFFVDLARLDRVYRMLSVIGLGLLLLIASYLYQRLRLLEASDEPSGGSIDSHSPEGPADPGAGASTPDAGPSNVPTSDLAAADPRAADPVE
jgi:uncharacterized membrane protein